MPTNIFPFLPVCHEKNESLMSAPGGGKTTVSFLSKIFLTCSLAALMVAVETMTFGLTVLPSMFEVVRKSTAVS